MSGQPVEHLLQRPGRDLTAQLRLRSHDLGFHRAPGQNPVELDHQLPNNRGMTPGRLRVSEHRSFDHIRHPTILAEAPSRNRVSQVDRQVALP
jgi:hypothetical protein